MAKKLDKSKPYGEIYGGGRARYEQGAAFFDVHGELVIYNPAADPDAEAKAAEEARLAEEKAKADAAAGKGGKVKKEEKQPTEPVKDAQAAQLDDQLAAQATVTG